MKPNQFAKDYKKSFSPGEGPTAKVLGEANYQDAMTYFLVYEVKHKKGKDKMTFTVDPSDRAAFKALDPADACEVEFLTPCDAPPPPPAAACTYADTACAAGAVCPGGTAVSAECADRSRFNENPCACTALQQLAGLSSVLQAKAPWNDLANAAYCQAGSLVVGCAPVGGVQLLTLVDGYNAGLVGALPPSLGDLGPSLEELALRENAITSVPTELGALTGMVVLDLAINAITSVPTELGALTSLKQLLLYGNAITSVPTEVGALTGLDDLNLYSNAITSVPTELAALTDLAYLGLNANQLTEVPTEFRTVNPSFGCLLSNNPGFSCANVGAGTSCCTGDVQFGNNCGEGLSGGPCYAG